MSWRKPLDLGRLLLLSIFPATQRRPDIYLSKKRNELVAALADEVFTAYAEPGGKIEKYLKVGQLDRVHSSDSKLRP
jgi:hypothetical protein